VPIAYLAYIAGFRQSNGWIAMLFAVVASLLIFTFYEEPLRKRIRTRFSAISKPIDSNDRLSAAFAAPASRKN